jgi:hypothetical protein
MDETRASDSIEFSGANFWIDWLTATINDLHTASGEPEDVDLGSEPKLLLEVDVVSGGTRSPRMA